MCDKMSLKFLYDDSYCFAVTDPLRSTQSSSLLCRDSSSVKMSVATFSQGLDVCI